MIMNKKKGDPNIKRIGKNEHGDPDFEYLRSLATDEIRNRWES